MEFLASDSNNLSIDYYLVLGLFEFVTTEVGFIFCKLHLIQSEGKQWKNIAFFPTVSYSLNNTHDHKAMLHKLKFTMSKSNFKH